MTTNRELEEDLKLTDTGKAFIDTAKSNTAKVAIIGGKGRLSLTTLAKMITNGEDIKVEIKGGFEMTKELIEDIRKTLIPFVKKELLEINNDGLGELDAEEFERDFNEILDLAIKALEQPTSDDCVSRAEVIDELNRLGRNAFKDDTDYDNFFAFVDSLPPVTPTHETCKDCKRYNRNEMFCTWHGGYLMQKCDPKYFCADFEKRGDSDGRN